MGISTNQNSDGEKMTTTIPEQTTDEHLGIDRKLSFGSILGYGAGDLGSGLVWGLTTTFLLYFYTDIFGITAAAVGTMFVVARVFDAVNDPIMGMLTERFHSRWGKFRHYLLFGSPILGLLLVLTFSTPDLGQTAKLVYAYVTYIGLGMIYTATNLPYGALAATMTQNPNERNALSVSRTLMAIIGNGLMVGILTPILVDLLGGDNAARGWQLTAIAYAVVGIICLWLAFFTTKERYVEKKANRSVSFKELLTMLGKNKPFILIALNSLFLGSGLFIRSAVTIYYVTYNLGREELLPLFLGTGVLALVVGLVLAIVVANKIGKKRTMIFGQGAAIIGLVIFHLIPYENINALIVVGSLISFFLAFNFALMWSVISDTVEYSEWQTGVRAEGGIYSVASFVMKLSSAIAGGVPALVLSVTNYQPNVAEQAELALTGIQSMMTTVPIVFSIIALIALLFYDLTEDKFAQIVEELAASKAKVD